MGFKMKADASFQTGDEILVRLMLHTVNCLLSPTESDSDYFYMDTQTATIDLIQNKPLFQVWY